MVTFIYRVRYKTEDLPEASRILALLTTESRREEGCITYIPFQLKEDPGVFLIYEQYRDEQALTAHQESAHFLKYGAGMLGKIAVEHIVENLTALI